MPNNLDNEGQFTARPFPKEIFTDYAYEQMRESEKYRDVRKALRQKALLTTSKYPPRMEKELNNNGPKVQKNPPINISYHNKVPFPHSPPNFLGVNPPPPSEKGKN